MEHITLIELLKPEDAFAVLDESAGLFGDNGGDPDGNAYLLPAEHLTDAERQALLEAGLARQVEGFKENYPEAYWHVPPREADAWCGYQIDEEVYWY